MFLTWGQIKGSVGHAVDQIILRYGDDSSEDGLMDRIQSYVSPPPK